MRVILSGSRLYLFEHMRAVPDRLSSADDRVGEYGFCFHAVVGIHIKPSARKLHVIHISDHDIEICVNRVVQIVEQPRFVNFKLLAKIRNRSRF